MIFDEKKLGEEIERVWGAHGAHASVYRMLLARLSTAPEAGEKAWDRIERRKDNWTLITKEYRPKYDFKYKDSDGKVYSFFGLVEAEDDYYYGLMDEDGKVRLASCVGALDGEHGWLEQIPNGGRCDLCNCVYPVTGPEKCDRYRCPKGDFPLSPQEERK